MPSIAMPSTSPPPTHPSRLGRIGVIGLATAAALVSLVGTASAHVTAQPGTATQGGFTKVSFRTPNEEDTAGTVKLEVSFPTDHPIAFVSTQPMPGWTATVDKSTLATPIESEDGEVTQAVSKITWSGGRIAPGQFDDFNVSLGPLPADTDRLVFKAVQTYDNGDVVRWIEDRPVGGPEPRHPAPALTLTPKAGNASTPAAVPPTVIADGAAPGVAPVAGTAAQQSTSSGTLALVLGIVGALLGLVGTVLGGLALRRRAGGTAV